MDKLNTIQQICIWTLPILFAVTLHEAAHGWVAYKFGDDTAHRAGRITANPLKHIDLVGTIIVPILLLLTTNFIFGWAKPVPVNGANLNKPKRDMAFVAAAGPISNFLMGVFWMGCFKLGIMLVQNKVQIGVPVVLMSQAGVMINLFLMVLNLIPIPPLDGSRVVSSLLPSPLDKYYEKITPFGFVIVLILLLSGIIPKIMLPAVMFLFELLQNIFNIKL